MKIYIAGPDVFLPNALEQAKAIKQLCEQYGHIGLFPLDNEVGGWHPHQIAQRIKDANISMIDECDIVIANLSPFRGPEPDSGTAWEVGYAQGLKKRVLAYSSDMRILKEKTQAILGLGNSAHDKDGMEIEDFSLTHNLMYADCVVGNSFEACLKHLNDHIAEKVGENIGHQVNDVCFVTDVNHEQRTHFGLSINEYCCLDLIYNFQVKNNDWCNKQPEEVGDILGLSRATAFNIVKKLIGMALLIKDDSRKQYQVSKKWINYDKN